VNTVSWFEEGFGEEYLAIYRHRDESEAEVVADFVRSHVCCLPGAPALDVGCGVGRHLRFLKGHQWTVGIDLSAPLLRIAQLTQQDAILVRADMRALPFCSGAFHLVVNLFTSFGYFNDDEQNQKVISEIARVTAPNGWFVLDYLNAANVRQSLVLFDRHQIGSQWVEQRREISTDGHYVQKAITIVGEDRTFQERVRLFELKDLLSMLWNCDFAVKEVFGDYYGGPRTPSSPRTIVIGQRL